MVRAPGVAVPPEDAERTRRRLLDEGAMRLDLQVLRETDHVVFPVTRTPHGLKATEHEFPERPVRPRAYTDLLDWPPDPVRAAPRAYDHFGDMVVVRIPEALTDRAAALGDALLRFHPGVRAVFHDRGVTGPYRTRDLERIAGTGGTATTVQEHGARIHVDPARAYYSPRLADERARLAALLHPGDRVVDLFCGVGAFLVLAARAGADAEGVDMNPAAVELARLNVAQNGALARVRLHEGDARQVAPRLAPADHVVMNLPHGAKDFLDVAAPLVRPGGLLHHNEIVQDAQVAARRRGLEETLERLGRAARVAAVRHVRNYANGVGHYAFDLRLDAEP